MYTQNEYLRDQILSDSFDAAQREAKNLRLLREAGLIQLNRLTVVIWQAAAHLGHALVAIGRRLERLPKSQPVGAD